MLLRIIAPFLLLELLTVAVVRHQGSTVLQWREVGAITGLLLLGVLAIHILFPTL